MEPDNNSSGRKTFRLEEAGAKVLANFKQTGRIPTENEALNELLKKYPQMQRTIEGLIKERDQLQQDIRAMTRERDAAVNSETQIRTTLQFLGSLLTPRTE